MSIKQKLLTAILFALPLMMASVATAQVDQNACAINKWVQLPDESTDGIDIRMDIDPLVNVRRLLADDFLCDQTGPITCIKFWGSWDKDTGDAGNTAKGTLLNIHLSIHADVPAAGGSFSYPVRPPTGPILWEMDFGPASFTETLHKDICPDPTDPITCIREGFWDPELELWPGYNFGDTYVPDADSRIWLYTVNIPEIDAFVQQGTPANPIVYWLDINVIIQDDGDGVARSFGWKTSIDHWNDNAVYDLNGVDWAELVYPPLSAFDGQNIDLAFEINTKIDDPETEACCYIDAAGVTVCDDLTVAECMVLNGTPLGAGIDCTIANSQGMCDPLPPPIGACCLPDGSCVETTDAVCIAHNGTYIGDGTNCTTATCPNCVPTSITCPSGQQSIGSAYLAGLIDNFAGAFEPATPDTALSNYIANCTSGYALQFDETPLGASANSWFGHTFTGLPTGIVSATLEFRARATTPAGGGGLAWNDTIGFVDNITGCTRTDLWINRFSNLPLLSTGLPLGSWNAGQAATFCLDLDALPKVGGGTTSVINDLASGRLSVWAQDDTGIDYLLLNITLCPCEYPITITIPVEVNDNFTAPDSEPVSPSAEIIANISALKGFDNASFDRRFVHTFSSLPANIIGGSLEIRMKPIQNNLSVNDSINLEFLNPNFRWGRAINTLTSTTGPTGPWAFPNDRTFVLDLANLPPSGSGETSVIGDMTDGDLDVYVQDDTDIDYMVLKVKVCCDEGIPGDIDHDGDVDLIDFAIGQGAHHLEGVGP